MLRRFGTRLRSGLKRISEALSVNYEPSPEEASSHIFIPRSDGKVDFLGSCFAYSSPHHFVTAAHCIRDTTPSTLQVWHPFEEDALDIRISHVITHPTADLAVLISEPSDSDFTPYREVLEVEAGEEVHAYGFHKDTTDLGIQVLDRHFHGVVQRLLTWEIQRPYSYDAIELSFAAPPGLSGGPLYKSYTDSEGGTFFSLIGMITGNRQASTPVKTITEVHEGSDHYIERIDHVTDYGIAINLAPYTKWLAKTCKGTPGT
jgi:S1-C subfamily serine protease